MLSAKIATYPQLVCLYNCSSEPDKYISSFYIYIFKAGCLSLDANPLGHKPSCRQAADDLISGGISFESLGYPASCTPVLKSAHRIIHSTTLSKMSMYVAGFGGNVSPDPETLKSQGYPWISRTPHRCRYCWIQTIIAVYYIHIFILKPFN